MLATEVSTKKKNKGAIVLAEVIDDLLIEVAEFVKDSGITPSELCEIVVFNREEQKPLGTITFKDTNAIYSPL